MDLTLCPECTAPAEIQWRAVIESTDGLVEHAKVLCARRHWFLLPVATLTRSSEALANSAPAAVHDTTDVTSESHANDSPGTWPDRPRCQAQHLPTRPTASRPPRPLRSIFISPKAKEPIVSEHVVGTASHGDADTTSTAQASHDPGSEESDHKVIDDLQVARIAETHVDDPSDWLPWDVT